FVDFRNGEGITKLVFAPEMMGFGDLPKSAHATSQTVRSEWVIGIRGTVNGRGANKNPKLPTGEIEVHACELGIFNRADTPPFEITDVTNTAEEQRLAYRSLDLRRRPFQHTLRARHRTKKITRRYLDEHGIVELDTSVMVKYT